MWPSRWFTPTNGTDSARASAFAAAIPTRSAPTSPGPTVTATPSMSLIHMPASTRASVMSGLMLSRWAREATSGTTPPKRSCRWAWLDSRFDMTFRPSATMATAVSSQDVSIPRTLMWIVEGARMRPAERPWLERPDAVGDLADDRLEPPPILGRTDVVDPHHQGVLVRLLVVVLAPAHRPEPELRVEVLRSRVGPPDLERHGAGPHLHRFLDQLVQEPGADLSPVVLRI